MGQDLQRARKYNYGKVCLTIAGAAVLGTTSNYFVKKRKKNKDSLN